MCSLPSYGWFNSHTQTDARDCRNTYFHNSVSACPAWDLCEILPQLEIVHHKCVWTTKKSIVNLVWTVVNINKDLLTEILAYVWWGLLRISVHTLTAYQTAYSAISSYHLISLSPISAILLPLLCLLIIRYRGAPSCKNLICNQNCTKQFRLILWLWTW